MLTAITRLGSAPSANARTGSDSNRSSPTASTAGSVSRSMKVSADGSLCPDDMVERLE